MRFDSESKMTGTFRFLYFKLSCLKVNNRTFANCGEALVSVDSLLCIENGSRLRVFSFKTRACLLKSLSARRVLFAF